jgi:group I intron endonuclease
LASSAAHCAKSGNYCRRLGKVIAGRGGKKMIIYKVTNLINGKIYIGITKKTLNNRKSNHLSNAKLKKCNMVFHAAIRKYGSDNFKWETIDRCLFTESLIVLEKHYIELYKSKVPNGYNMTDGGEGHCGYKPTCETRLRLSSVHKNKQCGVNNPMFGKHSWNYGKHYSEDVIKKMVERSTGRRHSEESKRKMSIARSGKPKSKEHIQKMILVHLGKKHSLERIEKNRISHIGIRPSEETKMKRLKTYMAACKKRKEVINK